VTSITESRALVVAFLVGIAAAVLPAAAAAATVSQTSRVQTGCSADELCQAIRTTHIDAAPGEANDLLVTLDRPEIDDPPRPTTLHITERGSAPLIAGAACTAQPDGSVVCVFENPPPGDGTENPPAAPPGTYSTGQLRANLGDGDDRISVLAADGHRLFSLGLRTIIDGGAGDDRILGVDQLRGGDGDDVLEAGPGVDILYGGDGNDRLLGRSGDDTIHGGAGRDELVGGDLGDRLSGGPGRDHLDGGPGYDSLHGGTGNDVLDGGLGPDQLWGNEGDDRLWGGPGHRADQLDGGPGLDRGYAGPGADRLRDIERTLPPPRGNSM
jgi:hemolysin type calcium-binding protein